MASADEDQQDGSQGIVRLHHGTDQASANDLLLGGVDLQKAATWNGSGEFWATTDHRRADWFAMSHPSSPPAARFEFDLPELALLQVLQLAPPAAIRHGASDYEFLPASHALLNQYMANRQVIPVP
jgi:hypothetical protein